MIKISKGRHVVFFVAILLSFTALFSIQTKEPNVNYEQSQQNNITKTDINEESFIEEVSGNQVEESKSEESVSSEESVEYDNESLTETHYTSEPQEVPSNVGRFKSYTNYQLLSKESKQWTKVQCNENAHTDENGLRKVGEYYCVAMGSCYAKNLGDLFEIKTEAGSFKVIICDFKADVHTDANNQYTLSNGCMVEFYVDMSTLNEMAEKMGDISYADDKFYGEIISVIKLGNYFGE